MLVDSHCHLDFDDFEGERDDVVARARAAGIKGMLTICTRLSDAGKIRAIAAAHDGVWCTVGIHPHEAKHAAGVTAAELMALSEPAEVVGIGESGLDFYYGHSPRDIQETVFRTHIQAARETGLPIIVHTRDADSDTVRILAQEQGRGAFAGVIHCFSAGAEVARCALDHGMYISFSGIVTFKNAEGVRAVARDVPLERLLVETDAPYLAPVPVRGKRNEPAFTAHTAAYVAEIKGLGPIELARATTDNFFTLFRKANRDDLP